MDLNAGKIALLQAMALMSDEGDLQMKISNLMDLVHEDKSRTVTLLCEALAMHKQEIEKKKKVVELLEEITQWWTLLVEDREKLLLTISNMEMEKEELLKQQQSNPRDIYGHPQDMEASFNKKPRLTVDDDDDFKDSPKKPDVEVVNLDA